MSIDFLRNYGSMKDLFFIYHAVLLFLLLLLPLSLSRDKVVAYSWWRIAGRAEQ